MTDKFRELVFISYYFDNMFKTIICSVVVKQGFLCLSQFLLWVVSAEEGWLSDRIWERSILVWVCWKSSSKYRHRAKQYCMSFDFKAVWLPKISERHVLSTSK